jgi:Caspase domain
MQNVFAILVAINEYNQSGIKDLEGCLNDLEDINRFLEEHCNKDEHKKLNVKILTNAEATRQAVIEGFKLFDNAQNGDVCLFYFSGHGSQIDAPKEFYDESEFKLEAIVCHVEKDNDNLIIDKELSFLIGNAQKNKDVHFVVITDSCHSGSNTKDTSFNVRSVSSNINSREIDTYLGRMSYREYKDSNGEVRLKAPLGKHFKLSACTNSEVAKEKILGKDNKVRGVFTFSILEVLKSNGYNLSYLNLVNKVRIKTRNLTKEQSPQLEIIALHPQERNRVFLNGLLQGEQPIFHVSYNKNKTRWEINVGSIYGIQKRDIAVILDRTQVEITEVEATYSILDFGALSFYDRDKIFDATVTPKSRRKLKIGFSTNSNDITSNTFLVDFFKKSQVIELTDSKDVSYVIRVVNETLALTHPESSIAVFPKIHGQGEPEARLFRKIVEHIAEWHYILSIDNPNSKIKESEVEIRLSAVEKPYTTQSSLIDSAPSTLIEDWHEDNVFCYHFDDNHPNGPWHTPAFRLSIINKSATRKLWASALYCGIGYIPDESGNYISTSFSITNQFLEKKELSINDTAKLMDAVATFDRVELESITLTVLDDYFDQGYNEIKDTIKIFVSTEEIDTSPFNMVGIPINIKEDYIEAKPAGILRPQQPQQSDWRTFEIPVTIVRPRDEGILNIGQSKSFYGLTIVGHLSFSARIILSTMEEFIRSTKIIVDGHKKYMPRPEILYSNENVCPLLLTHGFGDIEGCSVIELYRTKGAKSIDEEQPLVFRIDSKISTLSDKHQLILVGYSSKDRTYYSLGTMNDDREIHINILPFESPSVIDGLGNSIKLILLHVKSESNMPPLLGKS